jgi:hypothetical protein
MVCFLLSIVSTKTMIPPGRTLGERAYSLARRSCLSGPHVGKEGLYGSRLDPWRWARQNNDVLVSLALKVLSINISG